MLFFHLGSRSMMLRMILVALTCARLACTLEFAMSARFARGAPSLNYQARLAAGDASTSRKRKQLQDELAEAVQEESPYGDLGKFFPCGEQDIPYICPFAFLSVLTRKSYDYARFLAECTGDRPHLRILLYADEVVPGLAHFVFEGFPAQFFFGAAQGWPAH